MMYTQEEQKRLIELSRRFLYAQSAPTAGISVLEAAALVTDLQAILRYHEWRYYQLDDPQISDFEYDTLFKQLSDLESRYPELQTPDSPTLRVGNDLTETGKTVQHLTPMLSLENSYNADDLADFDKQVKKWNNLPEDTPVAYIVEPKFDGGTIVLVYENDVLVQAATRGNGTMGEDMTNNAKVMRSIPLRAAFSKFGMHKVELRGEALIKKSVFEHINQQRSQEGLGLYANPRNAATGGLRTKDPKETKARGLEAFVYQMGYASDAQGQSVLDQFQTHHETIELLGQLGFQIPEFNVETKLCENINEVAAFCQAWQDKRDSYDYEIDGMVVKVNDLAMQQACGATSHHPRWAIAYKFKAKQATTKLLNIEYQVGKIGSITPVAKLQPVALAGVTVSSVSLHNEDFITSKDIRLGDTVLVERAGDVIPYIVKPMVEGRDGSEKPVVFPEFCPINTQEKVKLVREEGESAWRCPNCTCGAQDLQRFIFHVSKDAMDIEGLSKATIERFQQLGWLRQLPDIYRLDYATIATLDGFGKKSAENLEKAIEKAKKNPIHRLLHSLSIHHLGKKAAKLIAAEIEHVSDLYTWDTERYLEIKEIGPVLAENAVAFFHNPTHQALLATLEELGVNMAATDDDRKPTVAAEGPLAGKTILFTGTLVQFNREMAETKAAAAGATLASSVSKNLNILVVGEKAGSKLKKAQALGTVTILTEQEFIDLIQNPTV